MELRAHPFLRLVIFIIFGILLSEYSIIPFIHLIILSVLIFWFAFHYSQSILLNSSIYLSLIALGWLSNDFSKSNQESNISFEEQEAYLARISSKIEKKPKSYKALANVYKVKVKDKWLEVNYSIILYFDQKIDLVPQYGDLFLISSSPSKIKGPQNPFEFDYKNHLNRKGIQGSHYLQQNNFYKLAYESKNPVLSLAHKWNRKAQDKLNALLQEKAHLGVAKAMLLGTRDDLDMDTRSAYANAGAIHILAVSGLHVGILMLMLEVIFGFLKKNNKTRWLHTFLVVSILWAYALFTGLSASVTRATLMFSLFLIGSLIKRDKNSLNILAASAFILLLIKPSWLFDIGFQLSYLAMLGIILLFPYLNRSVQIKSGLLTKLWQISIVSFSAQLLTFPISIYYFHQFPTYFLLSNPLVTVLSTCILLFGLPGLLFSGFPIISTILDQLLIWSLKILNAIIFNIANLPKSTLNGFYLDKIDVFVLYFFLLLLAVFYFKKNIKYFYASVLTLLVLGLLLIKQDNIQSRTNELAFHHIKKNPSFSFVKSKSAVIFTDSVQSTSDFSYQTKNYYNQRGIPEESVQVVPIEENLVQFNFKEKNLLWIKRTFKGRIKDDFDFVLISHNSIYNLRKQFVFLPEKLILDSSNSYFNANKIKTQADSLGIDVVMLSETGGVIYPLKFDVKENLNQDSLRIK